MVKDQLIFLWGLAVWDWHKYFHCFQDGPIWKCPQMGKKKEVAKIYLSAKICHTYFMIMNLGSVILEDINNLRIHKSLEAPPSSTEMRSAFFTKNFVFWLFGNNFTKSNTPPRKGCFNQIHCNFNNVNKVLKLATQSLFKRTEFPEKKGYGIKC